MFLAGCNQYTINYIIIEIYFNLFISKENAILFYLYCANLFQSRINKAAVAVYIMKVRINRSPVDSSMH